MEDIQMQVVPSLNHMEMARATFTRHQFPLHFHDTYVIQVVDHGSDKFDCAGQRLVARPGDLIIIRPHAIHSGAPASPQKLVYRAIYPSGELVEQSVRGNGGPVQLQQGVLRANQRLHRLFERTFDLLGRANPTRACRAFSDFIEALSDEKNSRAICPSSERQSQIAAARRIIHSHFDRSISLDELSEYCGLNQYQLIRAFQREIGMPPHQYIINYRLLIAKRLLQDRQQNLSQVALESGFADQSHLNRVFRKYFGMTPGRYRKDFRQSE